MSLLFLILVFVSTRGIDSFYIDSGCSVSIAYGKGDLKEPQPLVLRRNGTKIDILQPTYDRNLIVPAGQSIYLACPGTYNTIADTGITEAEIVCIKDQIFSLDGIYRDFSSLICKFNPTHTARSGDSSMCKLGATSIEIGFQLEDRFLPTVELCRDDRNYTTYYTKFRLTKTIAGYQSGYPRPKKWLKGPYYSKLKVDDAYKFENQLSILARILDSTELAKKALLKSSQFLSRGHLTAKADFVYGALQRSTFWYMNAAPQWQSFNGGNWNALEDSVRRFAANRRLDLDVYTGVFGQMSMKDVRGNLQPIRLYVNEYDPALKVPKYYWKVIYDPLSKTGTAFVGLNDPFVDAVTEDHYICDDISSTIKWLSWNPENITAGISYACTIDDFRNTVPHLPDFEVTGILV